MPRRQDLEEREVQLTGLRQVGFLEILLMRGFLYRTSQATNNEAVQSASQLGGSVNLESATYTDRCHHSSNKWGNHALGGNLGVPSPWSVGNLVMENVNTRSLKFLSRRE